SWSGISVDPSNQNVYATVFSGDIYKQTAGSGDFIALSQTSRFWVGISVDSSNQNVYATDTKDKDIFKQTVSRCSSTSWGSDNIVELTSCGIPVTTSSAEYKIMITPKTHANMPAVPGASYATTATVTSITATNSTAGTDTDSATITVDNASPAAVTSSTATLGDTIVDLAWTNPADSDFTTGGTVVVLRRATSAVADVPVEGTTYSVSDTIGTATVACVVTGSPPATSYQDSSLSNGTAYHYKIFTQDSNGNYNAGTVPTGSPATPAAAPDAPTNVSATDGDHTDKVTITWTKSSGATGYRVYEGSNELDTLGDVATYDDTLAAAGTITPGTADASDGTSTAHVALSLSSQSANNGASRTYKVVAFNGGGDSPDSDTDDGYRGVGALTYQWQRSAADSDADYSNISGGTTASYNDTAAPSNGDGRYFKCVQDATGATQQTSTSDRGYRLQAPPTVALNTPNDEAEVDDTIPTLNFTGTDANSDDVEYNVQVGDDLPWDVTSAIYSQEISVFAKEENPTGLFFKSDGTKMYTVGTNGITVDEYNLSTAWDVASASYLQEKDVSANESGPSGLFFKPDGTKMYTIGGAVDEYNLGTAWDVTSAVYSQEKDLTGEDPWINDILFKPDGTKMYMLGSYDDAIYEYNLGTAWDVTSAVYSQNKATGSYDTSATDAFFTSDGLKMYTSGNQHNAVDEYNLGTAWDVTSAAYSREISIGAKETDPTGLFFKPDGTKMYTIGYDGDTVDEYDLVTAIIDKVSTADPGFTAGNPYTSGEAKEYTVQAGAGLSTDTTYWWKVRAIDPGGTNTYGAWSAQRTFTTANISPTVSLHTPDDEANVSDTTPTLIFTGTDTESDDVEYNVQVGDDMWDVTTATYSRETGAMISTTDLFFKPDGTKMYTTMSSGDTVDEYDLSVAWDVTSATYSQQKGVGARELTPTGLFFRPDGTKMYTIGMDGDTVDEYDLDTAWDVTSASYLQEKDVNTKESDPMSVFFRPDGTKMYTIGFDGDTVDEYNLSVAWNVDTAVYSQEKSVNSYEAIPTGLFFTSDGLKMYTVGDTGNSVDEYDLSTAWDVTSAAYSQEKNVSAQENNLRGVFFKPDGTKMYTIGAVVDEYDLGTALIDKVSTADAGFTAGHPFTSGAAIDYTVQVGDALSIESTYWWRARAIDPSGNNAYGDWCIARTFTIPNLSPTVALNTPNDEANVTDTTPTLNFTGTDSESEDVEYNVQVGDDMWDVTTAIHSQEKDISAREANSTGLFFKPDGTKMYTIGSDGDSVDEYDLSPAWDVTSANYLQEKDVSARETGPSGVFFKPDGTKMYTMGGTVDEYDLSTAWDVASAVYSQEKDVSGEDIWETDLFFKPDGTKMYMVGSYDNAVYEYNLSIAWDVTSAVYSQNKVVGSYDGSPADAFFRSDGLKMYTIGRQHDTVDEYNLGTAWDVTSVTYSQEISIGAKEIDGTGLFFKPDGTKMYTIGYDGDDTVDEYDIGTSLIDKVSTADPGFTGGNPYTSGVAIDYTVQVGDALPYNATYWWKVRAIDPGGSNAYGAWCIPRTFTLPPDAPTNVSATDGDHTDKVTITWTKSAGATGYRVYEGSNLLDTLGDVATYDDTNAAAGTITPGSADASDGTSTAHVALSLSGQSANNGNSRTYKVVAFNGVGDSPDSSTDDGYRGVGALTYQWQRSAADSDASYSNISGGTTASYNDTAAPANGDGRYFQCVQDATGATQQISSVNRGYRSTDATDSLKLKGLKIKGLQIK
ncbi:hypothetical protein ACFL2J_02790, partial [Candidatus Omnitrophota bacterium]